MKDTRNIEGLSDIEKIKNFLISLGFVTTSDPSAQNLIYTKKGETVVIENNC